MCNHAEQFHVIFTSSEGRVAGTLYRQTTTLDTSVPIPGTRTTAEAVFCPETILGDIVSANIQIPAKTRLKLVDGKFEVTLERIQESSFGFPVDIDAPVPYRSAVDETSNILAGTKIYSADELEKAWPHLALLEIYGESENPLYGKHKNARRKMEAQKVERRDFNKKKPHTFSYACSSLGEAVISIVHFLLIHNFRFIKCPHCGLYFATKAKNQKYCTRSSPYKEYAHLECEQAVRNIKQQLARHKKSRTASLSHRSLDDYHFLGECAKCEAAIDACSSVENLEKYAAFLEKENFEKLYLAKH